MAGADKGLKVFVSYARADGSAFAEQLIDGLEIGGFEPFLDRHDIAAGEDWQTRLEGLIAAADTLVYVISPASIASERCGWEVEKARQLSKRVLPVVLLEVPDKAIPPALARLNFIYFNRGNSFPRALKELVAALKTDEGWIREHTRLAEEATRWVAHGRDTSLLLRGPELEAARKWLAVARPDSPPPTDLHRELIRESASFAESELDKERQRLATLAAQQADKERALKQLSRRTTLGLTATSILLAAAGGLAYWGLNAEARFNAERKRADDAFETATQEAIVLEASRTDLTGQFVANSTGRGGIAMDGTGDTSPFTDAALKMLADADTSLFDGIIRTQDAVLAASTGRQRPFVSTDLNGEIYLGHPSQTRKLTALVVGASDYENVPTLANPVNDAAAWARFLRSAGFEVQEILDPTLAELRNAIGMPAAVTAEPVALVSPTETAQIIDAGLLIPDGPPKPDPELEADALFFFFFSGHGLSIDGQNFIVPTDADVANRAVAKDNAVNVNELADLLRARFQASVIILDAMFNDPFLR